MNPVAATYGTVTTYDFTKDAGWITPDGQSAPVFVHYSEILVPGINQYKTLEVGARVAFDIVPVGNTPKTQAARVETVHADGSTPLRDALAGAAAVSR